MIVIDGVEIMRVRFKDVINKMKELFGVKLTRKQVKECKSRPGKCGYLQRVGKKWFCTRNLCPSKIR